MGAIATSVAIGSALFFICIVVVGIVFCRKALRDGGEFEVEIKAPTLAVRLRAAGAPMLNHTLCSYSDSEHGQAGP